jgi:3-deoxy-manno-octulosonate cytidylyltransferase (CMP-KDO synthetase)
MNIIGIIPARYASTRFPGKPLVAINGKPMIQHVYEKSKSVLSHVVVATDDVRIEQAVRDFGGEVVMTSELHKSGTDRCAEVLQTLENKNIACDVVINIQGDEPFLSTQHLELLASAFSDSNVQIATLIKQITDTETLFNANTPKVILDKNSNALYFSRSTIPYLRNYAHEDWLKHHVFYKHIGIYAYRSEVLKAITKLEQSSLELAESLEQNRWLENNYSIKALVTEQESIAIDTPDDLKKISHLTI